MSTPVPGLPESAAFTSTDQTRVDTGRFNPADAATRTTESGYDAARNWSPEARLARQKLVINSLADKTGRLAQGLRLFEIPNRESLRGFRAALSSDPDNFTATAADDAGTGLRHVEVKSLARSRTNIGRVLTAATTPDLNPDDYEPEEVWDPYETDPQTEDWTAYETDPDTNATVTNYAFDLTVEGETTAIDIQVVWDGPLADDNIGLLNKIGHKIAAADTRLDFEVVSGIREDENGNPVKTATLIIRADEPGSSLSLALEDTSGNLVETLGLARAVRPGTAATLKYNGAETDSETNDFTLENGSLTVTAHGLTTGRKTVDVTKGLPALVEQTDEILRQYNEVTNFLNQHRLLIEPSISIGLHQALEGHRRELAAIGLESLDNGLIMMTDKYETMLRTQPEQVRSALTGPEGFFTELGDFLEEITSRSLWNYAAGLQEAPQSIRETDKRISLTRSALNLSIIT